jgi:hypothetical protein
MPLADVRQMWPGFVPPQSFRDLPMVGEPGFALVDECVAV